MGKHTRSQTWSTPLSPNTWHQALWATLQLSRAASRLIASLTSPLSTSPCSDRGLLPLSHLGRAPRLTPSRPLTPTTWRTPPTIPPLSTSALCITAHRDLGYSPLI